MGLFDKFCKYLSSITTIDALYLYLALSTMIVIFVFWGLRRLGTVIFRKRLSGRKEYWVNQIYKILLNILEVLLLVFIWDDYIKDLMTLISVLSAAMTIALRELILNFFCGIYIQVKKPFKVEDRIEIDGIKGDVMSISTLDFEVLEISNKDERGQSTGVVITFPNSVVFSKPVKNITKGFKYVWDELTVRVDLTCDLSKNKQTLYKIVNELEVVKSIPKKMKEQVNNINNSNRIYFNQYDPIIYTKLVKGYVELTIRYLMHPKKSRFVESVIWNKIYLAYKEGKIDLYTGEL
ncbi:MAG: mechanosensitive ion channel family protein [Mycoplasmatota bacterium]|nr:mechanosensitive ion channel family protein [Mycoplasmatota bacterium]